MRLRSRHSRRRRGTRWPARPSRPAARCATPDSEQKPRLCARGRQSRRPRCLWLRRRTTRPIPSRTRRLCPPLHSSSTQASASARGQVSLHCRQRLPRQSSCRRRPRRCSHAWLQFSRFWGLENAAIRLKFQRLCQVDSCLRSTAAPAGGCLSSPAECGTWPTPRNRGRRGVWGNRAADWRA